MTEPRLHALRLAARHVGAVLDVCDNIAPDDAALLRARAELDELLDLSGPVRDAQLRNLAIENAVEDADLRAALLRTCAREQVSREKSAARRLARLDLVWVLRIEDRKWQDTSPRLARAALRAAIRRRRRKLLKRVAALRPDDADSVHKARIALKRYRYLLHVFAPYAGDSAGTWTATIGRLHHRLGRWHDARVTDHWLDTQSAKRSMQQRRTALRRVREQFEWCDHEQVLLVAFLKRVPW
jgi:CHAD domain-containing protein